MKAVMDFSPQFILIFTAAVIASNDAKDPSIPVDNKFAFAVLANPQAFHLKSGGDSNDEKVNGEKWREINKNIVKALNKMPVEVSFGIINGDATESGLEESWAAIVQIYYDKDFKFPFFLGLGNRDYQDNVANCTYSMRKGKNDCSTYSMRKGKDGCAIQAVKIMEENIENILVDQKKVKRNFSADVVHVAIIPKTLPHSYSYSWDHKNVHFVQLHNFPTYKVNLKKGNVTRYIVGSSLTWLTDDLRMARHRGITDIIFNFHQYEGDFLKNSTLDEQHQFHAIIQTYKPLAVFTANETEFVRYPHKNHTFYDGTTVYGTSAAFDGKFHNVLYDNGSMTVEEWDTINGSPIKLQTHTETRSFVTPVCKVLGSQGVEGDIYGTTFIPPNLEWNLVSALDSEKVLAVDDYNTDAFLETWSKNNSFQAWGFDKIFEDGVPDFSSWYRIRNLATGDTLISDTYGAVYTISTTANLTIDIILKMQWRPIKISGTEVLLINRLNRFLSTENFDAHTEGGYDLFNKAKIWQIKHYINQSTPDNVRFFKAEHSDSWKKPFPESSTGNQDWKFLSYHDYGSSTPCIGW